jgi:hypothetical protein
MVELTHIYNVADVCYSILHVQQLVRTSAADGIDFCSCGTSPLLASPDDSLAADVARHPAETAHGRLQESTSCKRHLQQPCLTTFEDKHEQRCRFKLSFRPQSGRTLERSCAPTMAHTAGPAARSWRCAVACTRRCPVTGASDTADVVQSGRPCASGQPPRSRAPGALRHTMIRSAAGCTGSRQQGVHVWYQNIMFC